MSAARAASACAPVRALFFALLFLVCSSYAAAQTVKLESGWKFLVDKEGALRAGEVNRREGWRDVRVGLSWNAQFEDMRDYMGVAWYRTHFKAPDLKDGRRALITFGAVDYFCEVFVNGQKVGEHEGGYTPFDFDVTEKLKPGANELLVRVVDPPMDEKENRARFPSMIYNEIPHGKQNWYVQTGGIWQAVNLEILPRVYVERLHVTPRTNGDFSLEITLRDKRYEATAEPAYHGVRREGPPPLSNLDIIVRDPDGELVYRRSLISLTVGQHTFQGRITWPRLWTPDKPSLYTIEVSITGIPNDGRSLIGQSIGSVKRPDAGEVNVKREQFGFRSFEARDGKFYLNGEPFYMIAALDQDFYPETVYTAPSEEYVRDAMRKAKRLGLNTLRCHIKVCEPVYLKVADEEGLLVWYEIPSWNDQNHFTPRAAERGERILNEMTERDWNHPSIVIQSIINESWGADLKKPEQRRWLREAFDRAKKLTAPRGLLVVDNSACCDNFHVKTDINDFHQYFSQPDNFERWDSWVAEFAARPRWTFSQHGDAETTRREPLVVSEFGNWGLPKLTVDLPWWFARDFGGREVTRPAGVLERFKEFHLSTLFHNYNELAEATEWHQFRSLKHEIEEIRRYGSIQGYVITEFTDINWEANGLMDMWRNPKAYADELRKLQQPDVVTARTDKLNYTSGEPVRFEVLLSHYSRLDLTGAELLWRTGAETVPHRHKIGPAVVRAGVSLVGRHLFNAPEVASPRRERILLEVIDSMGALVAENSAEVFIYPKTTVKKTGALGVLALHDPQNKSAELGRRLAEAGYDVRASRMKVPAGLLVATALDDFVLEHLRTGGRAIILADSKEALPPNAPLKVVPREGDLDGNWVTNFNWVRTNQEPFSAVSINPILGFEGIKSVPRFVIQSVPGAAYRDVLSGIFYGWINNNAALCVQMKAGAGKLILTTFRFDAYGRDPYATHLLDAMIRYVNGQDFAPRLDWNAPTVVK